MSVLRISLKNLLSLSLLLQPTVSRPVCLEIKYPSRAYDMIFITVRQLRVCWCGTYFSDERTGLSFTIAAGPAHSFSGRSPVGLKTVFYCLMSWTVAYQTETSVSGSTIQAFRWCLQSSCLANGHIPSQYTTWMYKSFFLLISANKISIGNCLRLNIHT
jgi:hypothetical protein